MPSILPRLEFCRRILFSFLVTDWHSAHPNYLWLSALSVVFIYSLSANSWHTSGDLCFLSQCILLCCFYRSQNTCQHLSWSLFILTRLLAENCDLLGSYTASNGNSLPTFWNSLPFKEGPIGCPETSVRNYHFSLRNSPEERSSRLFRGESPKLCKVISCSLVHRTLTIQITCMGTEAWGSVVVKALRY